jgi:hypothetical protein
MIDATKLPGDQVGYRNIEVWKDPTAVAPSGNDSRKTAKGFAPELPTMARPNTDYQTQAEADTVSPKRTTAKTALGGVLNRWERSAAVPGVLDISWLLDGVGALPPGWHVAGRIDHGVLQADNNMNPAVVKNDVAQATRIELTFSFDLLRPRAGYFDAYFHTGCGDRQIVTFKFVVSACDVSVAHGPRVCAGRDGKAQVNIERTPEGGWRCNGEPFAPMIWTSEVSRTTSELQLYVCHRDPSKNVGIERIAVG